MNSSASAPALIRRMMDLESPRRVVWFSCGAASAVALKIVAESHTNFIPVYCDTSKNEHPDNKRFLTDIEQWVGTTISTIASIKYTAIEEVFAARKYMSGIKGAPCTVELKKIPRFKFQHADDVHVFGLTADEEGRIRRFEEANFDLHLDWVLRDRGITKEQCYERLRQAGITLPTLYSQGFKNNNCIGCVKATSPAYWSLVRRHYPDIFVKRAVQSRQLGVRLTRLGGKRIFLDELPAGDFVHYKKENISCGPECRG